jgi:hypothetical protein
MKLSVAILIGACTTVLSASSGQADSTTEGAMVPDGWTYQAIDEGAILKRPHQIGSLNEKSAQPIFTTSPVLLIPVPGFSKRSQTAQLARLAKEVAGIVNPPSGQHDHTSKKIRDGLPRVEAQYGNSGKGLTWAYASVEGENILVMMTQSRSLKPPTSAREEFFKMARAFRPDTEALELDRKPR